MVRADVRARTRRRAAGRRGATFGMVVGVRRGRVTRARASFVSGEERAQSSDSESHECFRSERGVGF